MRTREPLHLNLKGNGAEDGKEVSSSSIALPCRCMGRFRRLSAAFLGALLVTAHPTQAALADGGKGPQLLIGLDDDRQDNRRFRAAVANQSLNRTDVLTGGQGNDVLFGLNGSDVIDGGQGQDIILGGPDAGAPPGGPPNSDIMFGGPDDDVNLWAPGDGSEVFAGGPGNDALIFGATDREVNPDPATGVACRCCCRR